MGSISQEYRELLEKQPWDDIIKRATLYAARRLERYEWQGSKKGVPPGGRTAQDFVNVVIVKLFEGDRIWNPDVHPNLVRTICGMIRSEISNCLKSNENKETRCEASLSTPQSTSPLNKFPHPSAATDGAILELEEEIENDHLLISFMTHIQDDAELMAVFDCQLNGIFKPKDIAASLGFDTNKMENIQKRWKRRTDQFQKLNGKKGR